MWIVEIPIKNKDDNQEKRSNCKSESSFLETGHSSLKGEIPEKKVSKNT